MHTSRSAPLLSGILAGDAMDEHGRTRPPAGSHTFIHAFIQTNASTQSDDNAATQGYDRANAHGHDAATQGYDNAAAQDHGNSRPDCVAGRAATGFTSGLSSADEDSSGISGDH